MCPKRKPISSPCYRALSSTKFTLTIPGRQALPRTHVDGCVDKQLALPLGRSVVSLQPHASSAKAHEENHQDSMTDKSTLLPILIKSKAICVSLMSRSKSTLDNSNGRVSLRCIGATSLLLVQLCLSMWIHSHSVPPSLQARAPRI